MAYIGNIPAESYASFETETFSVSATTNYTLSHAVTNENEIRLVINGVVQQPGSGKAYTASNTTLTLTSATQSGDVMYAVYLGRALQTVNPPNASVGLSQLSATGTKNSTTFLRGDNTFAEVPAGGITQVDLFRLTSDINSNSDPISSNLERADDASSGRIGTGMSESSGTFTFPETGIYECTFFVNGTCNDQNYNIIIKVTQDNSSYDEVASTSTAMSGNRDVNGVATCIVDVTDVSNDKVRFCTSSMSGNSNTVIRGNTALNHTYFRFVRLGDT